MIQVALAVLLFLGFHFAGTYLVPADPGKVALYWPWVRDTERWALLGDRGPLMPIGWQVLQPVAAIATFAYLGALLASFGWLVPAGWLLPLIVAGAGASLLLYGLHPGVFAIIPILVDLLVLGLGWTQGTS